MYKFELIRFEEAVEAIVLKQLPGHPCVKEAKHGRDEDEGMKDIAASIKGDHQADDHNDADGDEHGLKHDQTSCPCVRVDRL